MHRGLSVLMAGLVLVGAACARGSGSGRAYPTRDPVVLHVTDNYVLPVEVFAVGSGTYYRMGTVLPGIPSQFTVRESMLGDGPVEFLAIPADSVYTVRSGEILLKHGDILDWLIADHLIHSVLTVRP